MSVLFLLLACGLPWLFAQSPPVFPDPPLTRDSFELILKPDSFDECFTESPFDPDDPRFPGVLGEDFGRLGDPPTYCLEGQEPNKSNYTYAWSLTKREGVLWVGTLANPYCYNFSTGPDDFVYVPGIQICELSHGPSGTDWRPPRIWSHNTQTGETINWSERLIPPEVSELVQGWRAAATHEGKVFFAGTGRLLSSPGMTILVLDDFDADGHPHRVRWRRFPIRYMARRFLSVDGNLYLATNAYLKGAILKWQGGTLWTEVGLIGPTFTSWITAFNNRIYAATWNITEDDGFEVWKSPLLKPGIGLTRLARLRWHRVWSASDHEPLNRGGGAMNVFREHLYIGTMHIPDLNEKENLDIYRINKDDEVELVIGQAKNGYEPIGSANCAHENGGADCATSASGFCLNCKNLYAWSTAVYEDSEGADWLLYGTLNLEGFEIWASKDGILWVPVTHDAFSEIADLNYGAKSLLYDGTDLYVSTASNVNLLKSPEPLSSAGWEVWKATSDKHFSVYLPLVEN